MKVAFLEKLPTPTAEGYNKLLEAAKAKGMGHQVSDMPMSGGDKATEKTPNAGPEGMGTSSTIKERNGLQD